MKNYSLRKREIKTWGLKGIRSFLWFIGFGYAVNVVGLSVALGQADKKSPPLPYPSAVFPEFFDGQAKPRSAEELADFARKLTAVGQFGLTGKNHPSKKFRVIQASDFDVAHLDRRFALANKNLDASGVNVRISDVSKTVLAARQPVYLAEASTRSGLNRRLSRLYRINDKGVMLTDWDFVADGASIYQVPEFQNAKVGEVDAVLVVQKSNKKEALWQLSWTIPPLSFEIFVHEKSFDENTADFVLSIARGLQ